MQRRAENQLAKDISYLKGENKASPLVYPNNEEEEECGWENDNWLYDQWNRFRYRVYRYWLVLSFILASVAGYFVFKHLWELIKLQDWDMLENYDFREISMGVSFTFLLVGCAGMMLAIPKGKSSLAQKCFFIFQFCMIASIIALCLKAQELALGAPSLPIKYELFVYLALIIIPTTHLVGCFAILRVFRKNHPLAKFNKTHSFDGIDEFKREFLEQNETIASELRRYDKQLKRWPYVVYKWWLKCIAFLEIMVILDYIFSSCLEIFVKKTHLNFSFEAIILLSLAGIVIDFLRTVIIVYSCLVTGVAIRTKVLAKAKEAVFSLKICVLVSIITYLLAIGTVCLDPDVTKKDLLFVSISELIYRTLIPVFTLIGALKVYKIIEKRDPFVKASSYHNDSYVWNI